MIGFVCVFFPALISLKYVIKEEERKDILKIIEEYGKYTIYINLIILLFLFLIKDSYFRFNNDMFSIKMAFLYLLVSSIIARFLPMVIEYINTSIKISIKRCKNEKSIKKNK